MQAVAQALVDRGHEVVWLASEDNKARVEATGATFVATRAIAAVDAPLARENATGILDRQFNRQGSRILAQVADCRAILAEFPADALLVDVFPYGARALEELGEIPIYATLGVIPFYTSGPAAPMPVSGESPPTSWLGLINNGLRQLVYRWILLPLFLTPLLNKQRNELGLKDLPYGEPPECFTYSPYLHIQASCSTLEFSLDPNSEQHKNKITYVGPLVRPSPSTSIQLPSWWNDVVSHSRVVGITQGTLAMNPTSLIIPSVRALKDNSTLLLVVVSPHGGEVEAQVGHADNVRYADWLPYHLLLPQLCLLITNGGYGSITQALSHGVPLVCAGQSEDKKDTAARVTWCGAGIDLRTDNPTPRQVEAAAKKILLDGSYSERAKLLGNELNELGGAQKAAESLEELAKSTMTESEDSMDSMNE
ncbi:glycosyltransferase family 1 protein [Trichoderma virens Gv29-8]|uniref:Glycosyltransferase family 1 protein n=1 Tax=Hypocrea virens (strain Gv29-8 / FGSC 10586) TaxID=413071 RepID=G9MPH8_HYPVG|nr:glycosyltransferase family 1 protein [Trichoderma virens Gv29-8]EHK23779.1 glycosyltransferase family 1 protein [Trichoderma virens Gv29-8]